MNAIEAFWAYRDGALVAGAAALAREHARQLALRQEEEDARERHLEAFLQLRRLAGRNAPQ